MKIPCPDGYIDTDAQMDYIKIYEYDMNDYNDYL